MELSENEIDELKQLEESLWVAETRFDKKYLERVFAHEFFEFGRSGRTYNRQQLVDAEPSSIEAKFPFQNFKVHVLDANSVLVTYVSEVMYEQLEKANRSSIWVRASKGWQIRFHQGTSL